MSERDIGQSELAKLIGVSQPTVSRWTKDMQEPRRDELAAVAALFGVHPRIFFEDSDSNHEQECLIRTASKTPKAKPLKTAHSCPIISWASAGERHAYEDQGEGGARIATDCQDVNCYALTLEGDSMSPIYMHGDVLVAAPNQEAQHGDLVVAKTLRDEVYYKRLEYSRDMKTIRLVSFNPNYPVMEFGVAELRFLHPVFSITRYPQQKFNH